MKYVFFWSFFLSKIKFESDSMGWIQIFDQLVAFSESANEPILEVLDHHFNFWTFIHKVVWYQNF